jgi:transaldolase
MATDGGACETTLAEFASVDLDALAARLQHEGAKSFVASWNELMAVIDSKSIALK